MLLLSLGPEAIAALLCQGQPRAFSGPDLTWLLFGPEMAQAPVLGEQEANPDAWLRPYDTGFQPGFQPGR